MEFITQPADLGGEEIEILKSLEQDLTCEPYNIGGIFLANPGIVNELAYSRVNISFFVIRMVAILGQYFNGVSQSTLSGRQPLLFYYLPCLFIVLHNPKCKIHTIFN